MPPKGGYFYKYGDVMGLNSNRIIDMINDKEGSEVAYDLTKDNPTEVKRWIPIGAKVLDLSIAKGFSAGIPVGKISSIAGLQSTGKSFLATKIAESAQKKHDMTVVYFDSESAVSPEFMKNAGVDLDNLVYVQAKSIEFVFRTMQMLLARLTEKDKRIVFFWDSMTLTVSEKEDENDLDPNSTVAQKPRILSKGIRNLVLPLANKGCALVILNQLKHYIAKRFDDTPNKKYFTPGGQAPKYSYSLEIWLTRRGAKSAQINNDDGERVGSEVKATIKKNRFGMEGRECYFYIYWGDDDVRFIEEKSWLEAISGSDRYSGGAWKKFKKKDGTWSKSFHGEDAAIEAIKSNDDGVRDIVLEILEEELENKKVDEKEDVETEE